jgi:hypothetical protein
VAGLDANSECRDLFRRSLFIVGAFGGNDYAASLGAFLPLEQVHTFVPHIVNSIGKGIEVRATHRHTHASFLHAL